MQKWMSEKVHPQTGKSSTVKHTVELFPSMDERGTVGASAFVFWGNVMPAETKRCKLAKSVYLSNGDFRVRANVYNLDMPPAWISSVVREVLSHE